MNLSSDYLLRTKGAKDGFLLPEDKENIDDTVAEMALRVQGGALCFLDVSRCRALTQSFVGGTLPLVCPYLSFLDISYTACRDISTICECLNGLRAFNMAGLQLMEPSLRPLAALDQLEILSVRRSNVRDIRSIAFLHCLRSLDIGETTLEHYDSILVGKRRLEEVFFDDCVLLGGELPLSALLKSVSDLRRLKLLNIQHSSISHWTEIVLNTVQRPLAYEAYPRRVLFFESVIANRVTDTHFFLTNGIDVHTRASPDDLFFFHQVWQTRCCFPKAKLATPFFVFEEADGIGWQLPCALHLAIFFNCRDVLKLLLYCGADRSAKVFVADIQPSNDGTLRELRANNSTNGTNITDYNSTTTNSTINTDANTNNTNTKGWMVAHERRAYHARDLVQFCYERNVHRFTEGMITQKLGNWKSVTDTHRQRLDDLLRIGGNVHAKLMRKRTDARRLWRQKLKNIQSSSNTSNNNDNILNNADNNNIDDANTSSSIRSNDEYQAELFRLVDTALGDNQGYYAALYDTGSDTSNHIKSNSIDSDYSSNINVYSINNSTKHLIDSINNNANNPNNSANSTTNNSSNNTKSVIAWQQEKLLLAAAMKHKQKQQEAERLLLLEEDALVQEILGAGAVNVNNTTTNATNNEINSTTNNVNTDNSGNSDVNGSSMSADVASRKQRMLALRKSIAENDTLNSISADTNNNADSNNNNDNNITTRTNSSNNNTTNTNTNTSKSNINTANLPKKKSAKNKKEALPVLPRLPLAMFRWQDHSMVNKLCGPPRRLVADLVPLTDEEKLELRNKNNSDNNTNSNKNKNNNYDSSDSDNDNDNNNGESRRVDADSGISEKIGAEEEHQTIDNNNHDTNNNNSNTNDDDNVDYDKDGLSVAALAQRQLAYQSLPSSAQTLPDTNTNMNNNSTNVFNNSSTSSASNSVKLPAIHNTNTNIGSNNTISVNNISSGLGGSVSVTTLFRPRSPTANKDTSSATNNNISINSSGLRVSVSTSELPSHNITNNATNITNSYNSSDNATKKNTTTSFSAEVEDHQEVILADIVQKKRRTSVAFLQPLVVVAEEDLALSLALKTASEAAENTTANLATNVNNSNHNNNQHGKKRKTKAQLEQEALAEKEKLEKLQKQRLRKELRLLGDKNSSNNYTYAYDEEMASLAAKSNNTNKNKSTMNVNNDADNATADNNSNAATTTATNAMNNELSLLNRGATDGRDLFRESYHLTLQATIQERDTRDTLLREQTDARWKFLERRSAMREQGLRVSVLSDVKDVTGSTTVSVGHSRPTSAAVTITGSSKRGGSASPKRRPLTANTNTNAKASSDTNKSNTDNSENSTSNSTRNVPLSEAVANKLEDLELTALRQQQRLLQKAANRPTLLQRQLRFVTDTQERAVAKYEKRHK